MKEIKLTKGFVAIVDDEDYDELSKYKWHVSIQRYGRIYACRNSKSTSGKRSRVQMHREVINATGTAEVDHINGNGLDNRKTNLRLATRSQNMRNGKLRATNRSGFIGASWHLSAKKWFAQLSINNRRIYLGLFDSAEDAAITYNVAARALHGEFAKLNNLPSEFECSYI